MKERLSNRFQFMLEIQFCIANFTSFFTNKFAFKCNTINLDGQARLFAVLDLFQ